MGRRLLVRLNKRSSSPVRFRHQRCQFVRGVFSGSTRTDGEQLLRSPREPPDRPSLRLCFNSIFDSHVYVTPSPDQIPNLNQQIQTGQSLAHSCLQSRHALVDFGRLYAIESSNF